VGYLYPLVLLNEWLDVKNLSNMYVTKWCNKAYFKRLVWLGWFSEKFNWNRISGTTLLQYFHCIPSGIWVLLLRTRESYG